MTTDQTKARLLELINPILESMGFELVELRVTGGDGRQTLQILADKEGGITLDECVSISRELGPHLEVEDAIKSAFVLEVSSPGVRRPLTKEADFDRFSGQPVILKTHSLIDGRKRFKGTNLGLGENGEIGLKLDDGNKVSIAWSEVASARLDPDIKV